MHKFIFILLASVLAIPSFSLAESKKIVKWVDSSGVTHYGDKLPLQEAGRNNTEMSEHGVVTKRNVVLDKKTEIIDHEKEQQKLNQERKDKILLASYTNANEIDLARDRNLQMDQASMQSLSQQKLNINNRMARSNKTAQGFKANKKPLPPYLNDELAIAQAESDKLDKLMTQRKASMESTRKHYLEEKERFIALKLPAEPTLPSASQPSAVTAEQTLPNVTVVPASKLSTAQQ